MLSLVPRCIFTGAKAKRKREGSGGHSPCVSTAFYNNRIDRSKWTMLYNIQNTCGGISVNNGALFNSNETYIDRPVAVWGKGYARVPCIS